MRKYVHIGGSNVCEKHQEWIADMLNRLVVQGVKNDACLPAQTQSHIAL
jgi:hypothetical protein